MKRYNPKEIEPKWQKIWEEQSIYHANLNSNKPKYIGFGMFNYASGAGIHIGHGKNFTLPDIILRTKRQQGFETYSPVGFDSFGLPAENYAIKTGTPPRVTIDNAIANYRKQYRAMGWSQDWSREIDTSQPEYYRWTQWIFTQLFTHGLAYQKESAQWWCTKCKTVLANEQVVAGKCWRHDGADDPLVIKKSLKQWFFKITDYADEILEATDDLNWTESVKTMQKNWIGRSEGAFVTFGLEGLGSEGRALRVFTTAYDTIYNVTFMVLAPEHPLVATLAQFADNGVDIDKYVQKALHKSELDRETEKAKTGILFEGLLAVNPANGAKVPVWIADYVMMTYGSGAIMAVPGGDLRDYEFAKKYDLPITYLTEQQEFVDYSQIIKKNLSTYKMANSREFNGLTYAEGRSKILEALIRKGIAEPTVQYKMRDWLISRQRYWGAPIPIIHCSDHGAVSIPFDQLPVLLPEVRDFAPTGETQSVLSIVNDWVNVKCPKCGKPAKRETDTMDGYACSSWYFLRYLDPHNDKEAWDKTVAKKWMPIDFYNGGDHAIAHLLYARFFMRFFYKLGLVDMPEPFKKMYYHAKIVASDGNAFSKTKGNGPDPLKLINQGYGADSIRTYIMFISPPDVESPWNEEGIRGCYRFLQRVWILVQDFLTSEASKKEILPRELLSITHKTIKKVTEDIDLIKPNTAIAAMMECINQLYKLKVEIGFAHEMEWRFAIESLLQLVAPFAPHMSEELWHQMGHGDSIHIDHWPAYDAKYTESDMITIVVQVNGKLRDQLIVPSDASKEEVQAAACKLPKVIPWIQEKEIHKVIFVPGKIVNFVV
jgi:leucyl-tRNA synthetase